MEDEAGNYLLAEANVTMAVAAKDGKLTLSVPGQPTYTLENVGGRRYKLGDLPGFFTTFRPAKDDPKETEMYLEQPQGNFVLKRVRAGASAANNPGAAAEYAGPLKELVGTYEPEKEGAAIEVTAREGKVVLVVPGQPPYPLAERSKDVLAVATLPETYSVLVRRDAAGNVAGLTLKQPEGEFAFRRRAEFKPPLSVDELMPKVVAAAGGEANLRRHKTMLARADILFEHQGVAGEATLAASAPDSYSEEVTLTALGKRLGSVHEFFDGARGGQEGTFLPFQPKSGKSLADARVAADFYAPLDWKSNFKTAEVKGTAKVGSEEAYVVVFTPEKGNPVTDYYSTKTYLLLRRDTIETQGPVSQRVTETFADYREVGGVFVPFTRVSNTQTFGDIVVKIKEVNFDAALPAGAFRQKLTGK